MVKETPTGSGLSEPGVFMGSSQDDVQPVASFPMAALEPSWYFTMCPQPWDHSPHLTPFQASHRSLSPTPHEHAHPMDPFSRKECGAGSRMVPGGAIALHLLPTSAASYARGTSLIPEGSFWIISKPKNNGVYNLNVSGPVIYSTESLSSPFRGKGQR